MNAVGLLAIDLDGTALRTDNTLSPAVARAYSSLGKRNHRCGGKRKTIPLNAEAAFAPGLHRLRDSVKRRGDI